MMELTADGMENWSLKSKKSHSSTNQKNAHSHTHEILF